MPDTTGWTPSDAEVRAAANTESMRDMMNCTKTHWLCDETAVVDAVRAALMAAGSLIRAEVADKLDREASLLEAQSEGAELGAKHMGNFYCPEAAAFYEAAEAVRKIAAELRTPTGDGGP